MNQSTIEHINACVIIPTYNNSKTLKRVLDGVLKIIPASRIIVVNDGATDSTAEILSEFQELTILTNLVNKGKGNALKKGLKYAIEQQFSYAITMDSDGQHFPEDLPLMINACLNAPNTVIMGSRNMQQEGVPSKSSFGNKFSNFWFKVETWITLPDTQTGFRVYPLEPLKSIRLFTNKFELEIEIIVRLAWKNIPFKSVPIQVKYDPNERISHFRPTRDFIRISLLNTVLCILALLYYYPKKLLTTNIWKIIKDEAVKPQESNLTKALSLGFGVFMGIFPIWGFQLLIGIPLAIFFRLNKVLFILAANISIPPMIPIIIYSSFLLGQYFVSDSIDTSQLLDFSLETIKTNSIQYFIGAIVLSIFGFVIVTIFSFLMISIFRKNKSKN